MGRDPYSLPGDPNLPPGVTSRMIEEFFGGEEYSEPDYTPEQVEAGMMVPLCDDDHDWTEAVDPEDETIRVLYCRTCGEVKEEEG